MKRYHHASEPESSSHKIPPTVVASNRGRSQSTFVSVSPLHQHSPSVPCEGKTIAYSGDTDWVDTLIPAARDADLFIAEAYCFDRQLPFHLDYRTPSAKVPEMQPRRLALTHMSADMLALVQEVDCETAYDGLIIELGD
jgi:ribonuclease BN (tRNA processing enzyme)